MQQVIASDHQESLAGKTHRDARDEEVELHSVLAILSSRKRERDATRRAPVTSIQKPRVCPLYCNVVENRHRTPWYTKALRSPSQSVKFPSFFFKAENK